jgi:hypothetical protein
MNKLTVTTLGLLAFAVLTFGYEEQANPVYSHLGEEVGQGIPATASNALEATLVNLEKQSWTAWQKRDGNFFQEFLTDDHVEVGFGGVTRNKATIVAGVASPVCVVKSYTVDRFELTVLSADMALLTYHASQDTTCGATTVPSPVWASSLYVRRGGRWRNAFYQQTQTRK